MATIADEINAISVDHGYTGPAPKTIAGAIDALADTLAGEDVEERRTIAGAINALAPYIGTGGGGGFEPNGHVAITISDGLTVPESRHFLFMVDSHGPLQSMDDISDYGNVYSGVAASSGLMGMSFGDVGGGLYVAVEVAGSNGAIDADRVVAKFEGDVMTGVTKFTDGDNVILTFQVPDDIQGDLGSINISYNDIS